MKRATIFLVCRDILHSNFNPHPLWRGRLRLMTPYLLIEEISIHTLCEEGDNQPQPQHNTTNFNFNPHPLWRGRPSNSSATILIFSNFNPHPLWRGRQSAVLYCGCDWLLFQSTPSVKRATWLPRGFNKISNDFNPHPLWRGRHAHF